MVSTAQMRLAHSIAGLGLISYSALLVAMENRSPEVESWKCMRQIIDGPAGEQTLLEMYRFVRRADKSGVAFEKACSAWMLRHQSPAMLQRYQDLQQTFVPREDEAQFDGEANSYLLERISLCLQDDPWAEEWRTLQAQSHQLYEFWWTDLETKEADAWKQAHPRETTDRLWKVCQGHAATPMFFRPGSIEDILASTKHAQAALGLWIKRFGIWKQEAGQQILHYYATKGLRDSEDGFILGGFGQFTKAQIVSSFQRDLHIYTQGVQRIQEAKVPFVLRRPIDPVPFTVKHDLEEYADFLAFLGELVEVPVVCVKE